MLMALRKKPNGVMGEEERGPGDGVALEGLPEEVALDFIS